MTHKNIRSSVNLLPAFFRTEKNSKFLSSTIDKLYDVPSLERISGYVGSKLTKNYNPSTDNYITEPTELRQAYQLNPALVLKDISAAIKGIYGFDDLLNQVDFYGGNSKNINSLFSPTVNSYDPHIDWDKFVNFHEYFWLEDGLGVVQISGPQVPTVSTITVTTTSDGEYFNFSNNDDVNDPTLYITRGSTFVLNIESDTKFYIKTDNTPGLDSLYTHNVVGNGTSQVIITVDDTTPTVLYYSSDTLQSLGGQIIVESVSETNTLFVDTEIIGKQSYTDSNGITLVNGLCIEFTGDVYPESYKGKQYIVEGVGKSIVLVDFSLLVPSEPLIATKVGNTYKASTPEYVTINRASTDLNPWSRYNRWFHTSVITTLATVNNTDPVFPVQNRAARPIIEFVPNIQLWNFGTFGLSVVDFIDTFITDAFSMAEESPGFYSDGVKVEAGDKIIFSADTDNSVRNKIYEVSFVTIKGRQRVELTEIASAVTNSVVGVQRGTANQGTNWTFDGSNWVLSQSRTQINQAPKFDVFDSNGNSYSDTAFYNTNNSYTGSRIFGYKVGTGTNDPVLGFPLSYKNVGVEGAYLFANYFDTESISVTTGRTAISVPISSTYIKIYNPNGYTLHNNWVKAVPYKIPVTQFNEITTLISDVQITVFDKPATITDLEVKVYLNDTKLISGTDYTLVSQGTSLLVHFVNGVDGTSSPKQLLLKLYTSQIPNDTGNYETPINLVNNPLNETITELTLSEISDHVKTMVESHPEFSGVFPGISNLQNIADITSYGSRLITNNNPVVFSNYFISDVEHNLITSVKKVASDYYQFKLNLINVISQLGGDQSPSDALDSALSIINQNKNSLFSYSLSDMLAYGTDYTERSYTVTNANTLTYSLASHFDLTELSNRSVLIFVNDVLLIAGIDYTFNKYDPTFTLSVSLNVGDTIKVRDYSSTIGSYVPPTPSKLGLYPAYKPEIFIDNTYVSGPVKMIRGHDGSSIVAYSGINEDPNFIDLTILEYEKRVFNNIKVGYNQDLFDINLVLPRAFDTTSNQYKSIINIVREDFLQWANLYNVDTITHKYYDVNNYKTYNFRSNYDYSLNLQLPGSWRAIYKFYFDTETPETSPWEMLGFSVKPSWWDAEYGVAPYTSGNNLLWTDIKNGYIRQGSRKGIHSRYARPSILTMLPVDDSGNPVDIRTWPGISSNSSFVDTDIYWEFGEMGPAEVAWRNSSLWPFAVQLIAALTSPADYSSKMFDPSRMIKDVAGNYVYETSGNFLSPVNLKLYSDIDSSGNFVLASGFSVFVIETGKNKSPMYLSALKSDLQYGEVNLIYKIGGFASKDKLDIIIDSASPTTANPGVSLPSEDFALYFNTSSPSTSISISGIIIERSNGKFIVKGYDRQKPYFIINNPIFLGNVTTVTVGGKSETFLNWTANAMYLAGQIVKYLNNYYRVINSANAGSTFDPTNYKLLSKLPIVGGVTVQVASQYETTETTINYGTEFSSIQDVYNFIQGYGHWLTSKGFVFDQYNQDISQSLDWSFSGKEFLFWTTQNWNDGSVITLSPFTTDLVYNFSGGVVDNVFNSFYDYSILNASGVAIPFQNVSVTRDGEQCKISVVNTADGIYFAKLNLIEKEHVIVLNNFSMFGDIIYDRTTGYKQARLKLVGFKTASWNGGYYSPGFIYDPAQIENWSPFTDYKSADVVKYAGQYYSAISQIVGSDTFDFTKWQILGKEPVAQLLPNFEYKISQFEDFYSLDIDNFDATQQAMAQHLIGYTPREYLDNIFFDPIAQYKFYQGFIREKGTKNAIDKLAKASMHNLQGQISYNEEWAFRVGSYGNYTSANELELPLRESEFIENSQIIEFVDAIPASHSYDRISYVTPSDLTLYPNNFESSSAFVTTTSTFNDSKLLLPVAGYVRVDDVTITIKDKSELLSTTTTLAIKEGSTVWLGFREDGEWDVYRYTRQPVSVINSGVADPGTSITFYTDKFHNLSLGDIVSVSGLDNGTDGVYEVIDIPTLTSFSVKSLQSYIQSATTVAVLFKFESVRISEFDDLISLQNTVNFAESDLVWTDTGAGTGKWEVYRKLNEYTVDRISSPVPNVTQGFGTTIASNNDIVLVSSPSFSTQYHGRFGKVYAFFENNGSMQLITSIGPNDNFVQLYSGTGDTGFGQSIGYDYNNSLIIAGAPLTSNVIRNGTTGTNVSEGMVVISYLDIENAQAYPLASVLATTSTNNLQFGNSLLLTTSTVSNINLPLMLVGAVGANNSQGVVYSYSYSGNTSTATSSLIQTILPAGVVIGDKFGYSMAGADNLGKVIISAPGTNSNKGCVYFYSRDVLGQYNLEQTVSAPAECKSGDRFGESVEISKDGIYAFVSSKTANINSEIGKIYVYKYSQAGYVLNQVIEHPIGDPGLKFAKSVSVNNDASLLVVTALGDKTFAGITFDDDKTTFDGNTCKFGGVIYNAGNAYLYNRYQDKFILSEELFDTQVSDNSLYGYSVKILTDNSVIVGAPNSSNFGNQNGELYGYMQTTEEINGWRLYRQQENVVDVTKIKSAKTINLLTDKVVDFIDIYDPVKGKIPGLADQDLRYKTVFDPAIYNTGSNTVIVDNTTCWGAEHVGELWWDLSSAKYMWYEQGEDAYRKNMWGRVFPGTTIDVYEWVSSTYLPSQWASLADTQNGLTQNISGQPKYLDDTVLTSIDTIDAASGAIQTKYYFWVKNSVIIPNVPNRRLSAYDIASLISSPSTQGLKYMSAISSSSLVITNVNDTLTDNNVYLNISKDQIDNDVTKHTEWLLLEENSASSMPNVFLNKKFIDSLLGHDSVGNMVPDPALAERNRYGLSIRPMQSMFKDRFEALRNIVEYSNSVLKQYLISDMVSFTTLNSKDEIPDISTGIYDVLLNNDFELSLIDTGGLVTAELSCTVDNGRISSVTINNAGKGYKVAPTVTVSGNGINAVIETEINANGSVIAASIVNRGTRYSTPPTLTVRPFTAIVQVDENSDNLWATYQWTADQWYKVSTQKYDTTRYWDYIDWKSPTYDPYKPLIETIDEIYQLSNISVSLGSYVKVKNQGNGRYIILERVASNGTFTDLYNIVYSESGTIQINDSLWNVKDSFYNWDIANYDQTLYDQYPDIETLKILTALKNDIFVGPMAIYWNKLFFKGIRYAFSEQLFLDWAFKTSFISVDNIAGTLDQRPVYKFQNSQYYEDYINEVKPYHTKVRKFQVTYSINDLIGQYSTDFDLPAIVSTSTGEYVPLSLTDPILNEFPRKDWFDNYKFSVTSIDLINGGMNYTETPTVEIITANGDTGSGATAIATISSGTVIAVEITNAGYGYTVPPTIVFVTNNTSTVTAKAVPVLGNSLVRRVSTNLKFDRVSAGRDVGNSTTVDTIIANKGTQTFKLTFAADDTRNTISVSINGKTLPYDEYSIDTYKDLYNGYHKLYSNLVLNNPVSSTSTVIVNYRKNVDLFHAAERIDDFYAPTSGMPGNDLAQLMVGVAYPGTQIITRPLGYSSDWDRAPFDYMAWSDPFDASDLDTVVDGGDLAYRYGSGVNPSDIIFDGEQFLSANVSHAPEELLPGQIMESISISVYTTSTIANSSTYALAYRQFKGFDNITQFKRIDDDFSTTLAAPLYTTSTTITVVDGTKLSIPDPDNNIPGIIFIAGERIQYFEINGNVLGRLTRATKGTGAKDVYPVGTYLVDQGPRQNIPYRELITEFVTTATNTNTYLIENITFNTSTSLTDQVEVYYGGYRLHKTDRLIHDPNITYDSGEYNVDGIPGDTLIEPEFYLTTGTTATVLTLNLSSAIIPGVEIRVMQRTGSLWYMTTGTLATDTSLQAVFLQQGLGSIPDKYHYGQI